MYGWEEIKRRVVNAKRMMDRSRPKWTERDTRAFLKDLRNIGRSKRWPSSPKLLEDENAIFVACFYARENDIWGKWREGAFPFRRGSAATVLLGMLLGVGKNALLKFVAKIEPEHGYILDYYYDETNVTVKQTIEIVKRYVADAMGDRPDVGCLIEFVADVHGIHLSHRATSLSTTDVLEGPWSERVAKKWGGETPAFMDGKESAFPGRVTPQNLFALMK